jgi:hypothetical protein
MRPQGLSRNALIAAVVGVTAAVFTAAPAGAFVVAPPSGTGIGAVAHADSLGDGSALLHSVRYDRPRWRGDRFTQNNGSFGQRDDGIEEDDESLGAMPPFPKGQRIQQVVQQRVCDRLDRVSDRIGRDLPLPPFCVSPH